MLNSWYIDFKPACFLKVCGEDSADFLQSQCTSDLRGMDFGSLIYTLWLNVKGKIQADCWVLKAGEEEFYLYSRSSSVEVLKERLESYIIADDVELEDLTQAYAGVLLGDKEMLSRVDAWASDVPKAFGWRTSGDFNRVILATGFAGENAVECLGPVDQQAQVLKQLSSGKDICHLEGDELTALRIRQGQVLVPDDMGSDDLPQEGPLASAVSYQKGCYLGQEVMARIHAMGTPRRGLIRAYSEALLEPGLVLMQAGRSMGEVRSGAITDGRYLYWVMLKSAARLDEAFEDGQGRRITLVAYDC